MEGFRAGEIGGGEVELTANGLRHLTLVPTGPAPGIGDLVDADSGLTVARIEPFERTNAGAIPMGPPASALQFARVLAEQIPQVMEAANHAGSLRVVFSPEIRKGLANGTLSLMRSGRGTLPTAVDASGKIVGTAVVLGVSTTLPSLLLPVAVGAVAAMAQQRWLEQTFAEAQKALARIEYRLRDDDFATLEAADRLVSLLEPSFARGTPPEQLLLQLAHTHHEVDRVFLSRRRFVERFKRNLEVQQNAYEGKTGAIKTWVGNLTDELGDEDNGIADELVLFLQAMITRARVGTCVASAIASQGDGEAALRLLDVLDDGLRPDFYDLHNRIRALAKIPPDKKWWPKVPGLSRERATAAFELVTHLNDEMTTKIGPFIPERDQEVSFVVTSAALAS